MIYWGLGNLCWLRLLCSIEHGRFRCDNLNTLFLNGLRIAGLEAFTVNRQEFIVEDRANHIGDSTSELANDEIRSLPVLLKLRTTVCDWVVHKDHVTD